MPQANLGTDDADWETFKTEKPLMKRVLLLLPIIAALSGCGVAAAPCRITSAGLDMIPLVGHALAAPTNACAAAID